MVQRLTYRRRLAYNTASNGRKIVKTPGGKLVYQEMAADTVDLLFLNLLTFIILNALSIHEGGPRSYLYERSSVSPVEHIFLRKLCSQISASEEGRFRPNLRRHQAAPSRCPRRPTPRSFQALPTTKDCTSLSYY